VDDSIVHVYNCITSPINGTINITRSAWYFAEIQCDFEYSIETISYRNGYVGFTNTESYPTRGPVFGGSIKCEVIDADSVYFHDGEFKYYDFLKPLPTNDAGARISISGDTMYLHIVVDNYTGDRPYAYTHGGRLERILKYVR
jgi:hypothetical protein